MRTGESQTMQPRDQLTPSRARAGARGARVRAAWAWWSPIGAIALAALTPAGAPAQEGDLTLEAPDTATDSFTVMADRAERLFGQARYADAIEVYADLAARDPDNLHYRTRWGLCLYETGKLEDAQRTYELVLRSDPNNVVALIQMARIKARLSTDRARPKEEQERLRREARQELEAAASHGANSLRAIRDYTELKQHFEADIDLQLNLIYAPQRPRALRQRRDPFQNPLPKQTSEAVTTGPRGPDLGGETLSPQKQRELVGRIRDLLEKLKPLMAANDYEEIAKVWLEIEKLLRYAPEVTNDAIAAELKALEREAAGIAFNVKRLMLRAFYAQGEEIVTKMEEGVNDSDYLGVFELWQALNRHARRMIETDPTFQQTAESLLASGQPLYEHAKVLEEIDRFTFRISGIVAGAGVAAAIINDRIVRENGEVYGIDRLPIEGLQVVKIRRKRVRFRYKDTDFERSLESPIASSAARSGR